MDPVLIWTSTLILSGLLLTAGWHKSTAPGYYRDLIAAYTGMPGTPAALARCGVVVTELAFGLLLLLPASRITAAWATLGLLVSYSGLIAVSLARGLNMDCGCAGPHRKLKLSPWLLFRNAVLIGLAWLLTYPQSSRVIGVGDMLVVLLSSSVSILIYLTFEQLLSNQDGLVLLRNR